MAQKLNNLAPALLAWYDTVHADRQMPWRQVRDPYAIWISEIMLQQTQVETVKAYYTRFLERFPTVGALAAAPLQEVLGLWAGLGYYRRAKHLHAAAGEIVRRFGGRLPADVDALRSLPGIGRYTAGAIASIAFGLPAPVVDGNVMRVLSRVTAYGEDIGQAKHHGHFWEAAETLQATQKKPLRCGDLNQALMELGATVCTPIAPACGECPLRGACLAYKAGTQERYPVKAQKRAVPVVRLVAWVILRQVRGGGGGARVLLVQRPSGGLWEGMWEFPVTAGKSAGGVPEVGGELGMGVVSVQQAGVVKHQLTHRTHFYLVMVGATRKVKVSPTACVGASTAYVQAAWVPWPLKAQDALPMAAVVGKIAACAQKASGALP